MEHKLWPEGVFGFLDKVRERVGSYQSRFGEEVVGQVLIQGGSTDDVWGRARCQRMMMVMQDKEFECNVHEKSFGDSSRWLMVQKSAVV